MAKSSSSARAATMKIRFSDIIIKSKKVVEERRNGAVNPVMRINREKLRKEREEEKAMMEERAKRQRLREENRLALEKTAEEAKSHIQNETIDHLATMELANLCGGSRMARNRWWMKKLGLVLRTDDVYDDDDDLLEKAPRRCRRHSHDDYDLEEGGEDPKLEKKYVAILQRVVEDR